MIDYEFLAKQALTVVLICTGIGFVVGLACALLVTL